MDIAKENIVNANAHIEHNIDQLDAPEQLGLLCSNILSYLRTMVDHIAILEWASGRAAEGTQDEIRKAIKAAKSNPKLKPLMRLHKLLQISQSHYAWDEDGSVRLLTKYIASLYWMRNFVQREHGLSILRNLESIQLEFSPDLAEYYQSIAQKIDTLVQYVPPSWEKGSFRIQKTKPIIASGKLYYELTLSRATEHSTKHDRFIVFSCIPIYTNHAIRILVNRSSVRILDIDSPIVVLVDYAIAIRPCELNNLSKIIGKRTTLTTRHTEYKALMEYLTKHRISLLELCQLDDPQYKNFKDEMNARAKTLQYSSILDLLRPFAQSDIPGSNVVKYLLETTNNRVIKQQLSAQPCGRLSHAYLDFGCIPFDEMPLCTSLIKHNPSIYALSSCIDFENRQHEFFARRVKTLADAQGELYIPEDSFASFEKPVELARKHNGALYYKHKPTRSICYDKGHFFVAGYEKDAAEIIKLLVAKCQRGISGYEAAVASWIASENKVDCPEKQSILQQLFEQTTVAVIYGAAGTGKSTLVGHLASYFSTSRKLFLANTNPAIDNLMRRAYSPQSTYMTIASFLARNQISTSYDLIVIDECSTVGNQDMLNVLRKIDTKLILLVGDTHQIDAISFGNWFAIAKSFLPSKAVHALETPYRATSSHLIDIWNRVRNLDDDISEYLVRYGFSSQFDSTIFQKGNDDEVILCLNYDGLYGINNINRLLQCANPNPWVNWGMGSYKKEDPVLFGDNEKYKPVLYNNLKGWIASIEVKQGEIIFDIEVDKTLDQLSAESVGLEYMGVSRNKRTILRIHVQEVPEDADDTDGQDPTTIVPFQVAYAVSIHKAQGLEYESVKVIITDEVGEHITHNIFYTAITRARKYLKIFWSPRTQQLVLSQLETAQNADKAAGILKSRQFAKQ